MNETWLIYYVIGFIISMIIDILLICYKEDFCKPDEEGAHVLMCILFPLTIIVLIGIVIYGIIWSLYKKYIIDRILIEQNLQQMHHNMLVHLEAMQDLYNKTDEAIKSNSGKIKNPKKVVKDLMEGLDTFNKQINWHISKIEKLMKEI